MAPAPQPVVVIQGQPGLSGVPDASSLLQQQQPAAAPAAVAVQPQAATPTQQLQEHFVALQQAQQQQQATQQLQDQLVVLQHAQQQQLATQQQASSAAQVRGRRYEDSSKRLLWGCFSCLHGAGRALDSRRLHPSVCSPGTPG